MPITFGRIQTKLGRPQTKGIRILFDSGSSQTHVKRSFVAKLKLRNESVATWTTAAGPIKTSERCVVHFSLPEFSPTRTIAWDMHVGTLDNVHYDMIIGNDLLERLKIDIKYSTSTVDWEGLEIPMRPRDATPEESYVIHDAPATKAAIKRVTEILDAHYEQADLKEVVQKCSNLNIQQQEDLLSLLKKYESLFDDNGNKKITTLNLKKEQLHIMLDPSQFHVFTSKLYAKKSIACAKLESSKRSIAQNGQRQHSLFQKKTEPSDLYPIFVSSINALNVNRSRYQKFRIYS
jgi:hypothetical protein